MRYTDQRARKINILVFAGQSRRKEAETYLISL